MPVYLVVERSALLRIWPLIAVATTGALIGTAMGTRVLSRVPEPVFRRVVALLLAGLGVWMLAGGAGRQS
jgi:uncharacterized membrane protein YfcA